MSKRFRCLHGFNIDSKIAFTFLGAYFLGHFVV